VFADPAPSSAALRFAEAQRAAKALEYDRALTLAQEAVEQGNADEGLTRKLFRFQAEMAVAVGLKDTAISAFARLLELEPGLELPADASPRFREPFQRARERLGRARLTAVPDSKQTGRELVRTTVRIEGDLLHLVFQVQVRPLKGAPVMLARTDGFEGHWTCEAAPCPHHISVQDGRGNELLRIGGPDSPLLALKPENPGKEPDTRPLLRRGWPYVALAGALAVGGAVLAAQTARSAAEFRHARDNPGQYTIAQVRTLDRQRRFLFGGSAACLGFSAASLGLGIWWWSP